MSAPPEDRARPAAPPDADDGPRGSSPTPPTDEPATGRRSGGRLTGGRRPGGLRRRLALLVLVVGGAALVAYWSRNRPVDVTVIYDFGAAAPRVSRVTLSYARKGEETQPVALEFPTRTPRRYRHTLRLIPGEYTIRARVYLEATDSQSAEVRHHHRRVTIEGGEDQRLTLRLAR